MDYTFADQEADDRDIAIFTKRLETLLAATTNESDEVERLPAALEALSADTHLSATFRDKLEAVLEAMNRASIAELDRGISYAKQHLRKLNEAVSAAATLDGAAGRDQRRQATSDRDHMVQHIEGLETKRKQKGKFPVRSTLRSFTDSLEEAEAVPEFYLLALRNGFRTTATLRKVLQSLLSLWGFENQLR